VGNLSEEDKKLFREAVKGTKRLDYQYPADIEVAQKQRKKSLWKRRKRQQLEADHPSDNLIFEPHTPVTAFESVEFQRHNLKPQDWKKLKKGAFKTYWQLDLHGETVESADRILMQFIQEAHHQNARYLIIVHGKGYHSESDTPALKNLVNSRLRQLPFILAFCSAQPKDGGTGAVYVFLKQNASSY